jgi:prophage regulatory protein
MSEADLIEQLAEAVSKRMAPAVPLSVQLWNAKIIAGYLQRSPAAVMERVVTLPDFPRPIRLPTQKEGSKGQPLWEAAEVIAWARGHKERAVGRPRKID